VADELMITTMVFDPADRLSSFEHVAALARASQPSASEPPASQPSASQPPASQPCA